MKPRPTTLSAAAGKRVHRGSTVVPGLRLLVLGLTLLGVLAFCACGGTTTMTSDSPSVTPSGSASGGPSQQHGLVWKFKTGAAVPSSPAVSGGVVYVGSADGHLYAVDSTTGQGRWKFKTGKGLDLPRTSTLEWAFEALPGVVSSPAVADGVVYFGSADGHLYAVDSSTGRERWKFKTGKAIYSSPAIADGVVYFGSADGHLYAVDSSTGRERWKFKTGKAVFTSPAVSGGVVYVGSVDSHLYAVDVTTGRQRWKFDATYPVVSSPAVSGGIVYVGRNYFYAMDATSGHRRWKGETGGVVFASPAISNGVVYFSCTGYANYVLAADIRTGRGKQTFDTGRWLTETGDRVSSSPVISGGVLYFGTVKGRLCAADIGTGQAKWTFDTGGAVHSSPAVSGGVVYFGSNDGYLYAVK